MPPAENCHWSHFSRLYSVQQRVPFTHKSVFNTQNLHFLTFDKLHGLTGRNAQHHFTIGVWTLIIGDSLLGSYLLPPHLINTKYLNFFETFINFSEVRSCCNSPTNLVPAWRSSTLIIKYCEWLDEPNIYSSMDWLRWTNILAAIVTVFIYNWFLCLDFNETRRIQDSWWQWYGACSMSISYRRQPPANARHFSKCKGDHAMPLCCMCCSKWSEYRATAATV